jgi:glycerophosphoryl diester phosphodiesterase
VLDRVTNRTGRISELPYREVKQARVDGREPIPLLEELLGTFPDIRVNVDPKSDEAVGPLAAVLRRTGAVDRVCVGSFSDDRLETIREKLGPRLCTSLGPKATARLRLAARRLPAGHFDAGCAQLPPRYKGLKLVDRRLVEAAHERDMQVHVWTIDDAHEMVELLDLGVDGIMTDEPAVLRKVLEDRGQWVA